MHRPENPYNVPLRDGVTWNKEVKDAFEQGADAMLKAFIEMIESSPFNGEWSGVESKTYCDFLLYNLKQMAEGRPPIPPPGPPETIHVL